MRIAQPLRGMQVLHVSSTFYGGGGLKQQIEYGVSGFQSDPWTRPRSAWHSSSRMKHCASR